MYSSLCFTGVEVQLRMAGDSRVLMDHNMEIGVTPAQVSYTALTGQLDWTEVKSKWLNIGYKGSFKRLNM